MRRWTAIPRRKIFPRAVVRPGEQRRSEVVDRLSGKSAKEEVNYRASHDSVEKSSCAECEHYLNPGNPSSTCRRVAGNVEARDVCDLFVARQSELGARAE